MRVVWVGHLYLYRGDVNSQVIPISQIILPISRKCAHAASVVPELLALRSVSAAYPASSRSSYHLYHFLSSQEFPSRPFCRVQLGRKVKIS